MTDVDVPLLPSVLDRLLDDRPEETQDPARNRGQNLAILCDAVRRDLEALLNTRRRCVSPPPGLDELATSLVEYGVPEFLSINAQSGEAREEFRRAVEQVIRRFEPRFQVVTVKLVEDPAQIDRTLRFRIDALMYADPAPEYVSFDSTLNPASHSFSVVGRRDG